MDELRGFLVDLGATDEQADEAIAEKRSIELAATLSLWGGTPNRSLEHMAAALGVSVDAIRPAAVSAGIVTEDDDPVYVDADLALFAGFGSALQIFDEAMLLRYTFALAQSTARIAEASVSLFVRRNESGNVADVEMVPDVATMRVVTAAVAAFTDTVPAIVERMLLHNFAAALTRYRDTASNDGATVRLAVVFVDLTDSTGLVATHGARAIEPAIADFEIAASTAAARRGGRLVKLIGDAAMFVVSDPAEAAGAAAEVVAHANRDERLAGARAGVAYGALLHRDGDYFGDSVNRAARLVDIAESGDVVVDAAVAERLDPSACRSLGRRQLRGFEDSVEVYALKQ